MHILFLDIDVTSNWKLSILKYFGRGGSSINKENGGGGGEFFSIHIKVEVNNRSAPSNSNPNPPLPSAYLKPGSHFLSARWDLKLTW